MVELNKKYGECFKQVQQDALQNVAESKEELQQRQEELTQEQKYLIDLRKKKKTSRRSFWNVLKALHKLARVKDPTPEEVKEAVTPCIQYITASEEIPSALETVQEANAQYQEILTIYQKAERELKQITDLITTAE